MAPSVLGIGIPATSDIVPWVARGSLQKSLNAMEADMNASPYDWEMLYITPDMSFDICTTKLREKKWDVVMIGGKCFLRMAKTLANADGVKWAYGRPMRLYPSSNVLSMRYIRSCQGQYSLLT
jgi:hypothetical protein